MEYLQCFVKDTTANQQDLFFKNLNSSLAYQFFVSPADLIFFPEIIQVIPIASSESFKRNMMGDSKKELFIFEPWRKNKNVLKYPVNETIQFK